jgi:hypothetical protein
MTHGVSHIIYHIEITPIYRAFFYVKTIHKHRYNKSVRFILYIDNILQLYYGYSVRQLQEALRLRFEAFGSNRKDL